MIALSSNRVGDLATPALVVDIGALDHNLATMAAALPGPRLRPHVKAHKCTALARRQAEHGHPGFTCATPREVVGLARAGLGHDILLANETLDPERLRAMASCDARVTVAVDSPETIEAAAAAGIREALIDVNVGLPRCGCRPADAGRLADLARRKGLDVRGVMGYEGHLMIEEDRSRRAGGTSESMERLLAAHADVGGDVISAGGTGTFDLNAAATEIQAGSYALMDTAYARLGTPFRPALSVLATVVSVSADGYAVADCGLKSLGMDHGNPSIAGARVWFCSDEHITYAAEAPGPAGSGSGQSGTGASDTGAPDTGAPDKGASGTGPSGTGPSGPGGSLLTVGGRVFVTPAHVDPTVAYHETMHLAAGPGLDAPVIDTWPVDLRGW